MTRHDRVRRSTSPSANREIRETTADHIDETRGEPERIRARLHAVDAEWDVERALLTISATLSLTGVALGARRPRWLFVPSVCLTERPWAMSKRIVLASRSTSIVSAILRPRVQSKRLRISGISPRQAGFEQGTVRAQR